MSKVLFQGEVAYLLLLLNSFSGNIGGLCVDCVLFGECEEVA